ncbi:AAA family ATPase [Aspergillus sp. HF37]|nr:AAA family ATPase [Aspergillus sp. HF37]
MRSKPVSSLQKTYDECYLVCSTAVYFEGQNNEDEALRSWRSALETIYYHNAYRLPSKYSPRTETEKALHESIRQLEIQCRERVDLLQALHESRKDSQKDADAKGKRANGTPADANDHGASASGKDSSFFLKGKKRSSKPTSPATATTPTTPTGSGSGSTHTPGWIGDGTIPAVGYTDLSRPPPLPKMSSQSVPSNKHSGRSRSNSSPKTKSRPSSPDKRPPMPTTLRSADAAGHPKKKPSPKKNNLRRKEIGPAASQAAGLAWESVARSPSSEKAATNSGDERARRLDRADASNDYISALQLRDATPTRARRPLPTEPRPLLKPQSSGSPVSGADTVQPPSSPKPAVKPKPVPLRASQQASAKFSHSAESDPEPSYASPRRSRPANTSARAQATSTSRTRVPPTPVGKHYSPVGGRERLDESMNQMSVSAEGPARRKPQARRRPTPSSSDQESSGNKSTDDEDEEHDAIMDVMNRLPKGIDADTARQILNDIVVRGDEVHWDDIAGLEGAKKALKEAVVYPFLRPDLFSGLREPARGMLLFGPPGTGKTMLARAVATESKSTFFSVSASTLTSKWHGESEKLVRALFGLAKALAPSIIFVDEIDSLLSSRSSGAEHEASRRSKTEFLIQWSDLQGAAAGREQSKDKKEGDASRVLVLAATNMPWDIDEAARRRFVRRQYIPLPEHHVRGLQVQNLLSHQIHELSDEDIEVLVRVTEGFSGSDITALAKDAAMGPLRNLGEALLHTPMDQIRPIRFDDFEASLCSIRPSVSQDGLREYEEWARKFGERGG